MDKEMLCMLCSRYTPRHAGVIVPVWGNVKQFVCWYCAGATAREHKRRLFNDDTYTAPGRLGSASK